MVIVLRTSVFDVPALPVRLIKVSCSYEMEAMYDVLKRGSNVSFYGIYCQLTPI